MNDRALKVLEQYELEIIGTRRGRGAYILETTGGLRILSDYTGSEKKALFQNCVMQRIREGGYGRVDMILPAKEGNLVVRDREDNRYVVKEWYAGRECDTASENEILAATGNLARLHRLMQLEGETEFAGSFTAQSPARLLGAQNTELKKVRSFMRKRNDKGPFERLFLDCFPVYFAQASEAERRLELIRERLEQHRCASAGSVCHGDYSHHHILMAGYEIATTNFECCRFDFQINDLYRFMRKILEKHNWNPRLGMRMLDQYTLIRPVTPEERRLLHIRMLYPEKFHKLANYYYGSSKAWISGRFLEKLEQLNRQMPERNRFVKMLE